MDLMSANRIACFVNDTVNGSVYFHLKDLAQELEFNKLNSEDKIKFHPVIELQYTDLKIQAFIHLVTDFGEKPIFGTRKNPLPPLDHSKNMVDLFDDICQHFFKEKYYFHFCSNHAVKLVSLIVGLEEICLKFDGMQLQKEELARQNQLELSQALYRTFAIHSPEVNCVSNSEVTHFAEKEITIVPHLKDGAWTIYTTKNNDILSTITDHYALWDGFHDKPVYFNAQIHGYTRQTFMNILKNLGWSTSTQTSEMIFAFEINQIGGDVYTESAIDAFIK